MANSKLALFLIVSLLVFSVHARSQMEAAQAANEVDLIYCTKSPANMMDYCTGYCELQTGESCSYDWGDYPQASDPETIEKCECICGVSQQEVTYTYVPCGVDLNPPRGGSGDYDYEYDSTCCGSAFLLLAAFGFAARR